MRELAWEDTSTRLHYLCVTQFYKIIHHMTTPLVRECLPPRLNSVYPTNRTFQHYPLMDNFFMNSYFPYTIKKWDQLDPALRVEPDFDLFKIKLKQQLKPAKYKHYHCGFKLGNKLVKTRKVMLKFSSLLNWFVWYQGFSLWISFWDCWTLSIRLHTLWKH